MKKRLITLAEKHTQPCHCCVSGYYSAKQRKAAPDSVNVSFTDLREVTIVAENGILRRPFVTRHPVTADFNMFHSNYISARTCYPTASTFDQFLALETGLVKVPMDSATDNSSLNVGEARSDPTRYRRLSRIRIDSSSPAMRSPQIASNCELNKAQPHRRGRLHSQTPSTCKDSTHHQRNQSHNPSNELSSKCEAPEDPHDRSAHNPPTAVERRSRSLRRGSITKLTSTSTGPTTSPAPEQRPRRSRRMSTRSLHISEVFSPPALQDSIASAPGRRRRRNSISGIADDQLERPPITKARSLEGLLPLKTPDQISKRRRRASVAAIGDISKSCY